MNISLRVFERRRLRDPNRTAVMKLSEDVIAQTHLTSLSGRIAHAPPPASDCGWEHGQLQEISSQHYFCMFNLEQPPVVTRP
jgi:hypothetical protein